MPYSSYSRVGYMAIKAETTENTAVKPNVFIPVMNESVSTKYKVSPAMPVEGNVVLNLHGIADAIDAPTGKISLLIEPKSIGYILKALFGAMNEGVYLPITGSTGTFVVGETITGGTSAHTATVVAVSAEGDYLLVSSISAALTIGETLTGGTSSATGVLGTYDSTVIGHEFVSPQTSLSTYSLEFGFANQAIRYTGVRFHSFTINQKNNIIMADITVTARSQFRHARITAVTASGGGTKVITVDQTTGILIGDIMKIYRPSTDAELDFNGSGVKINTVTAVGSETSVSFSVLTTSVAVGDLLVLNPQTPSYTVANELSWIGRSTVRVSETSMTAAVAASADAIEDFEVAIVRDIESRWSAGGSNLENRFPSKNFEKGLKGTGKLKKVYTNDTFMERLRNTLQFSLQVVMQGDLIGSTTIRYGLDLRMPAVILDPYDTNIKEDALLDQDMPFTMFYNSTSGYFQKAILVNNIATGTY